MRKMKSTKRQKGFSLIEVLISVMVLGVGLIGLGSLQVASIKSSNNAHYRTTASMLAMDIADRMRTNSEGVDEGFYKSGTISCKSRYRLCRSSSCTAEELAKYDLHEVKCGLKRGVKTYGGAVNLLPSGDMWISCQSAAGAAVNCDVPNVEHRVVITWNNQEIAERDSDKVVTQSFALSVIP